MIEVYRFYHTHVLLRKSIKIRLFKLIRRYQSGKIDKQEGECNHILVG